MYLKSVSHTYLPWHLPCHEKSSSVYALILIRINILLSELVQEKYFYFISHDHLDTAGDF